MTIIDWAYESTPGDSILQAQAMTKGLLLSLMPVSQQQLDQTVLYRLPLKKQHTVSGYPTSILPMAMHTT
jgi:hypothetical protein